MDDSKTFIINFLKKSDEALIDAQLSIDNNRPDNALNRIYYAMFYSVMALGYLDSFFTSKHKQLMGWFNKKYINEEKIFDPGLFSIYREAYENRMEADYAALSGATISEIKSAFADAQQFVNEVNSYIHTRLKS